jgi:hypothetical protein
LRASAAVLGAAIWFERRAFEVVGGLVATTAEPRAKAALSTVSRHHAARAELLASVLPRTHDLHPDDVVVAGPDPGPEALDTVPATADRLHRVSTILAGSAERLATHRATLAPIADAPTMRVLDQVLADIEADRRLVDATARARPPI